jgi:hypothetical protein
MSHAPTPPPRPALRKAPDGSVHPASAVLSSLAVTLPAAGLAGVDGSDKPGKKGAKKGGKVKRDEAEETAELVVTLPKSVRKALRRRAAEYGWTAEEAAAHVIRVWADR